MWRNLESREAESEPDLTPRELGTHQLSNPILNLIFLWKTLQVQLRENPLAVEKDFKRARFTRDDCDASGQLLVVVMEQVLRQTGGSCKVSSRRAVFDSDCRSRSRCLSLARSRRAFHLHSCLL
jgi:hypothetical protein